MVCTLMFTVKVIKKCLRTPALALLTSRSTAPGTMFYKLNQHTGQVMSIQHPRENTQTQTVSNRTIRSIVFKQPLERRFEQILLYNVLNKPKSNM